MKRSHPETPCTYEETASEKPNAMCWGHTMATWDQNPGPPNPPPWKLPHQRSFSLKDASAYPAPGWSCHKYMDQMFTAILIITVKIWNQSSWPRKL